MRDDTDEDLSAQDLGRIPSRLPTHLFLSGALALVGVSCLALAWTMAAAPGAAPPMPDPPAPLAAERSGAFQDIPVRKVKVIPIQVPGARLPIVERDAPAP